MKNVLIRSLSGIIYIAVFVGCTLLGSDWFCLLTLVLSVIGTFELFKIESVRKKEKINTLFYVLSCVAQVCILLCIGSLSTSFIPRSSPVPLLLLFTAIIVLPALMILSVFSKSPGILGTLKTSLFSLVYIGVPMILLNMAYTISSESAKTIILILLVCIWINDTGAFCVGCTLGKHKLCERLSPKKSWEGFWGGMLFVVIAMWIYAYVTCGNILIFIGVGVAISALSTVGDLFESMLKRHAEVKDSGNIIPGHGGILDRIDSLLFVAYMIIPLSFILLDY